MQWASAESNRVYPSFPHEEHLSAFELGHAEIVKLSQETAHV